ncbi:MAG: alcohol dehydrogenase catalytic domain-containing protein [Caldilineaceae bacterium]
MTGTGHEGVDESGARRRQRGSARIEAPRAGPGQALIRVRAAGICGTDLHIYHDEFKTVPPVVMGHEVAGDVVAAGPDADTPLRHA